MNKLGVAFAVQQLNVCQTEVVRWHNANRLDWYNCFGRW